MDNSSQWFSEIYKDQFGFCVKTQNTLFSERSEFQQVDIIETDFYGRMLTLDGMVMTTEKDEFVYHEMISHIPLLAHPHPKTVLVIGGGDGGTVREVLKHPSVEQVVLCEIDELVIQASKQYLPSIAGQLDDPRVTIHVGDGAAFVAKPPQHYDVILIDSTDPVGPGARLFNNSFYQNVLNALTDDGIMVNQSESPWGMPKEVQAIHQLLTGVFPVVKPYLATIPTYPGQLWCWNFCSKGIQPLENINIAMANDIAAQAKYYNQDVHHAAFALPNFVKTLYLHKEPATV